MTRKWQPSVWGRFFTRSKPWQLTIEDGGGLALTIGGQAFQIKPEDSSSVTITRGLFWSDVTISAGHHVRVDGLPNSSQPTLTKAITHLLLVNRRRKFDGCYSKLCRWMTEVSRVVEAADAEHRWLTHEMQQRLLEAKPKLDVEDIDLQTLLLMPDVRASLGEKASLAEEKLQDWMSDWPKRWAARNKEHLAQERKECEKLLRKVESKKLNDEQSHAVICFDNRVQVIASAGSGKTSTMVAKAIYAIHRKLVAPSGIIMLAFNRDAAEELKARTAAALERLGKENLAIEAMTFHSLGLAIIGGATGKKPHVPDWASNELLGIEKLSEIVDQLKDQSDAFRLSWDLFRLVFGRDLPSTVPNDLFDAYDNAGQGQLISLNGDLVASQEERMIANWLFYNGVAYAYERPYEHDTATAQRRQYFPDFFYPQISLYHEHFALDERGQAPEHFKGYLEDVTWKRELHKTKGTQLIETTSHQVNTGQIFKHLSHELTSRGIKLDPNPDRPIPESGLVPMEHRDLTKVLRSFITHFKSNSLRIETLYERLEKLPIGAFRYRYQMFLALAVPVIDAWDKALRGERGIDFEDMINKAAEHLERGHPSPYELVMADEYQDASRARARLCRALVAKPDRHLFAVGDDWQSINRFAGADVSVMTGFRDWFGHGEVLKLEKTFRCPQAICDASSRFVSKNPAQLPKSVASDTPPIGAELTAFQVERREEVSNAVSQYIDGLYRGLASGTIPSGRDGKTTIFVLGRYKKDIQYVPEGWHSRYGDRIDIRFKTIHTSKGDEADYVILPGLLVRGFPNLKGDDQVFSLVMPEGDCYPHGEERRLFYVALTRARRSIAMFTVTGQCSPFLDELVKDGRVTITTIQGEQVQEERCPACKHGVIVGRTGPYGEFRSCSSFPRCKYKPKKRGSMKGSPQTMRK